MGASVYRSGQALEDGESRYYLTPHPPATENPKAIGQIDSLNRGKAYAGGQSSNAATRMRGGVDTEGSSP